MRRVQGNRAMSPAETPVAKPHYWEDAVSHLLRRDRILKKLRAGAADFDA